jgi:hypothetical protein
MLWTGGYGAAERLSMPEHYLAQGALFGLELVGPSLNPSGDIRYSRGVRLSDNVGHGDPRASRGELSRTLVF